MNYKLWSIIIILMLLWVIGLAADITFGGYLHLLIFAAFVMGVVLFLNRHSRDSPD